MFFFDSDRIYSAVKQYSFGDYLITAIGFLGMATPNFLMAIILMYISYVYVGDPMLGIFSPEFVDQACLTPNLLIFSNT